MLAAELRLGGVDVLVLEREPVRPGYCRGFTLNARSLDLLARRGLADALLAEGHRVGHAAFGGLPVTLHLAGAFTDHPCTLGIPQTRVEELLEEHARAAGARLRRGHELLGFTQDDAGVTVRAGGPDGEYAVRARFLAGCDGSRSRVRKLAGIDFPGTPATRFSLLGDVESGAEPGGPDPLPPGVHNGPGGSVFVIPRPGYVRVITGDPAPDTPLSLSYLRATVERALGRAVPLARPRWLTRFGDAARLAEHYRRGRVLLAGDAAHVHPPAGSIGVNVALDDAVNLGWKLAAAVHGRPGPLAGYHAERHAAGARVLAATRAQVLLGRPDERLDPVRDLLLRVLDRPGGNRALAEVVTGLDTRYEADGPEHPWLGRLVPDLVVSTPERDVALSTLLATGRGVLLDLTPERRHLAAAAGYADRVTALAGRCPAHPELAAVLVRPDGHAAWLATRPTKPATTPTGHNEGRTAPTGRDGDAAGRGGAVAGGGGGLAQRDGGVAGLGGLGVALGRWFGV